MDAFSNLSVMFPLFGSRQKPFVLEIDFKSVGDNCKS